MPDLTPAQVRVLRALGDGATWEVWPWQRRAVLCPPDAAPQAIAAATRARLIAAGYLNAALSLTDAGRAWLATHPEAPGVRA